MTTKKTNRIGIGTMRHLLLPLLALVLVASAAEAQSTRRPGRRTPPPVIGKDQSPPAPKPAPAPQAGAQQPGAVQLFGGEQAPGDNPFAGVQPVDDPKQPRPLPQDLPLFREDRALLRIDGIDLRASELDQLVVYYRSFRPGSNDLLLRDAVQALVPKKVCEAAWGGDLGAMSAKIAAAKEAVLDGADFAKVVGKYSDDNEAPTADARYTFGRELAVQPFDRLSHSGAVGEVQGPFLTKYGYHFLQILEYQRGAEPKDDQSVVRHVLVMYPALQDAADARALIKQKVAACRIEVLDPGVRNLVPPELRGNVVN